mmetsp:Transcript_20402/g.62160  ORF Transcript_20402/g.62160 Transcript_20402/m.62160 type:complete len:97 (+) Transcript_20402:167-457(+)
MHIALIMCSNAASPKAQSEHIALSRGGMETTSIFIEMTGTDRTTHCMLLLQARDARLPGVKKLTGVEEASQSRHHNCLQRRAKGHHEVRSLQRIVN